MRANFHGGVRRATVLTSTMCLTGAIGVTLAPAGLAETTTRAAPGRVTPAATSWQTAAKGWVLGFAPCQAGRCPTLLRTTNGGARWTRHGAPPLAVPVGGDQPRVVFSSDRDGLVSDGRRLFATHDGAKHWKRVGLPGGGSPVTIGSLAAGQERAYAVLITKSGSRTTARLASSPVRTTRWSPVRGISAAGVSNSDIAVRGRAAYVSLGNAFEQHRYWAAPDGRTWRKHAPACPSEAVTNLSSASPGTVMALCSSDPGMGSMAKELKVSARGGPFRPAGLAPHDGITQDFAAASATNAFVAAVDSNPPASYVHATFNGGKAWSTPLAVTDQDRPLSELAFPDPRHGVVMVGWPARADASIYRTQNGGHKWTRLALP